MEFKDKVYQARMQLGLTQIEFAKVLGLGFATVNRWENGKHEPTIKVKRKILQLCKENKIKYE